MKKIIFTLTALFSIMTSADAMSYEQAREQALFLTDKMAYELNLTDDQYEAAFEINFDYLLSIETQADLYSTYWTRRNLDLSYILLEWQYEAYLAAHYFYRPIYFDAGYWHFGIYARYPHRDYFYFGRPHFYATYRGGHSWRVNGRSFYEGRHDYFRPSRPRDQHFGMRNGWDRGDYRSNYGHSSTRVTADHHRGTIGHGSHDRGGFSGNRSTNGRFDNNHGSGSYRGTGRSNGSFEGNRSFNNNRSTNTFEGNRSFNNNRSTNTFEGSRSHSSNGYHGSGSFQGSRGNSGGSHGSGSFQGTRGGGSMSSGSHGGGHHGGGHSGGGRSGGSRR